MKPLRCCVEPFQAQAFIKHYHNKRTGLDFFHRFFLLNQKMLYTCLKDVSYLKLRKPNQHLLVSTMEPPERCVKSVQS